MIIINLRPAFPKEKLVGETMFKVSVEVLEGEYRILYNDEEVGKFPQRQSISLASHSESDFGDVPRKLVTFAFIIMFDSCLIPV